MKEKNALYIGLGFWAVIVILFTVFAFFAKQDCDIDKIYLYCRVHPFTFGDFIGTVLFYAGGSLLFGVQKLFGIQLVNPEGSSLWNWVSFGAAVAGIILIWNT